MDTRTRLTLRPLAEFPIAARRKVRAVLTDIDDTLTDEGQLTALAYGALERLQKAGLIVIPITGRPAGWCDMIARFWPVDAVVGENGAFYFRYDHEKKRMIRRYAKSEAERAEDNKKLAKIAHQIKEEIPGAEISADQHYRESDLAVDFCEDVPRLSDAEIDRIVAIFQEHGAVAKVSSIHVNGWFGSYDKLTMTEHVLREIFDLNLNTCKEEIVFAGDSPNDAPMFGFFPHAVGVANVLHQRDRLAAEPSWITHHPGGKGFAEIADALLSART